MKKQITIGILFILILSMVLAACAGATATPPPPTSPPATSAPTEEEMPEEMPDLGTIRVGILPIIAFANLMVAKEKGYFEEEGG